MSGSETAAAREWVTGLEPGSWFWSRDVPVRPEIARPVLSRLRADESIGLWKAARGLYWRGFPEGHPYYRFPPDWQTGALVFAGPGAGLHGWSALSALGWTLQCPSKNYVSALGKAPRPLDPTIVYRASANERRSGLNWSEVTVLEAICWFGFTEEPWHKCVERLASGESAARTGWDLPIRPSRLEWAAETEKNATVEALHMAGEAAAALAETAPAVG